MLRSRLHETDDGLGAAGKADTKGRGPRWLPPPSLGLLRKLQSRQPVLAESVHIAMEERSIDTTERNRRLGGWEEND